MSRTYKQFVVKEAFAVAAFNAGINALYTSYLWRPLGDLPLLGPGGIGVDLATTPIFIGLLSILFGTAAVRRKLASGRVAIGSVRPGSALTELPSGIFMRSLVIGILCGLLFAAPLWLMLQVGEQALLTLGQAIGAKIVITVAFSLVIVPFVVRCGLADVQRSTGRIAPA